MKKYMVAFLIAAVCIFSIHLESQTWSGIKRLTWTTGISINPDIAVYNSGNSIHVVWEDFDPSTPDIFFKKSTDGGATWLSSKRLTYNNTYSKYPSISLGPGNNIHVFWTETPDWSQIFYKKSTTGGVTWLGKQRVTWNSSSSYRPKSSVDSSNVLHLIWFETTSGNQEIFYKHSTDLGSSWLTRKRLTWNSGYSKYPDIFIDSADKLHVVWEDDTPGNKEIYYKSSTDGGGTWTSPKRLTWNSGSSYTPKVEVDSNGYIHICWNEYTVSNQEIYYKRSTDGGTTWSSSKRMTWNTGTSTENSLAISSDDHIHIIWHDNSKGNYEIFYKESTDSGATWSGLKRLTWDIGLSQDPVVDAGISNYLHVVWCDSIHTGQEIYYKNRK